MNKLSPEVEKRVAAFCEGLEPLLEHMSPLERIISGAILEYWQAYKAEQEAAGGTD